MWVKFPGGPVTQQFRNWFHEIQVAQLKSVIPGFRQRMVPLHREPGASRLAAGSDDADRSEGACTADTIRKRRFRAERSNRDAMKPPEIRRCGMGHPAQSRPVLPMALDIQMIRLDHALRTTTSCQRDRGSSSIDIFDVHPYQASGIANQQLAARNG